MQIEVTLPKLADDVDDAEVIKLLVAEGDQVQADQIVAEVGSDKAAADIQAPQAGTITKIAVSPGDTIPVGAVILTVEVADAEPDAAPPPAAPEPAAADPEPAPTPEPAPASEPTTATQPAPAPAPPAPPASAPPAPAPPAPAPEPQPVASAAPLPPADSRVAAGPAVRRFAREVGVDLNRVTGSGPNGRITREDVIEVVRAGTEANAARQQTASAQQQDDFGPVHIEPLPRIRRKIAEQMHRSWSTVPRVTNFDDADVSELERMRQASKSDYADRGIKLTTMPFLIKAVALALRDHPSINASIDMEQGHVVYKQYVNIGIAVDTDNGLVVPVLRNADQLSISEIARELSEIAVRVRDGKFSLADIKGSTFTISNLGAIGGTYSTPIVNVPEVAILLVGRSRKMPVVVDDAVAVRLMMPLSLSYDHRLVDGGAAARFLNEVIDYLESPSLMLLAP